VGWGEGATHSFDDLVGAGEDRWRNRQAERLGGFEIYDQKAAYRVLRKMKPLPDDELNCSSEDLLVFIDDTEHESFGGNKEYYGLGGCVVPGRTTDG
jgi:hypothetical protein